jgi:hypothetical protein
VLSVHRRLVDVQTPLPFGVVSTPAVVLASISLVVAIAALGVSVGPIRNARRVSREGRAELTVTGFEVEQRSLGAVIVVISVRNVGQAPARGVSGWLADDRGREASPHRAGDRRTLIPGDTIKLEIPYPTDVYGPLRPCLEWTESIVRSHQSKMVVQA